MLDLNKSLAPSLLSARSSILKNFDRLQGMYVDEWTLYQKSIPDLSERAACSGVDPNPSARTNVPPSAGTLIPAVIATFPSVALL